MRGKMLFVLGLLLLLVNSVIGVTLNLRFIENAEERGAVCNDGSPGGYYFRKGSVNTWVIHQMGGWCCWDTDSCMSRAQSSPGLVSSKTWSENATVSGIFSEYQQENPDFYTANMVYMGYCSSDNWAGTRDPIGTSGTDAWYFKGSIITKSIVQDLFALGLNEESQILFTGCSAGGKGVFNNVDYIPTYLPFTPAKYIGFSDEGWIADYDMDATPWFDQFQLGSELWVPNVNPGCAQAHPQHSFLCIFGSISIPYTTTPTLSHAEQYDIVQFGIDCDCNFNPNNATHVAWMDGLRSTFTSSYVTIHPPHSLFSPACASHCSSLDISFTKTTINGISMAQHLGEFWKNGGSTPVLIDDCTTFNCSVGCP